MKNESIRLPYIDELDGPPSFVSEHINDVERTSLSLFLDKDTFSNPIIMAVNRNPDQKDVTNQGYCRSNIVCHRATWYEFLLPIIKLPEDEFNSICKNIDESNIVELGFFPATEIEDQTIIDSIKEKDKTYTGNSYTLPVDNHFKWEDSPFSTESKYSTQKVRVVETKKFKEYEVEGEKYITYKAKGYAERIYKVEPLRWYVDTKNKELMCTTLPVCGIIYNPHPRRRPILYPKVAPIKRELSYNESQVCKYLEKKFVNEAILNQIPKRVLFEAKEEETLTTLINEISVYTEYYHGSEDVNQVIKDLIEQYNKDIDALKTSSGLQIYTEEGLHSKLLADLNRILDKIKRSTESSKEYYDLLKFIDSLIDSLDGKQIESNNELLKDIQKLSDEILPNISNDSKKQEEIKQRIFEALRSDREKVKSYLEYMNTLSKEITLRTSKDLEFRTLKEYELNFRIRLHPILESLRSLSIEEEKQALIDSKNKQLKELGNGKIDKDLINFELYRILESLYKNDFQENRIINVLLNEINSLVNELRDYGVRPKTAFNINIPSDDMENIVKTLNVIIMNLHKMILNAKESNEKHIRLSKYKISI